MNIIAHGLWGAALTPKKHFHQIKWAIFWSVFPDIFWGVAFIPWLAFQKWQIPQDWTQTPRWFYVVYGFSHSLVVWMAVWLILLAIKKWHWPMFFWLVHILIDIPGHTHFSTPFLFPLSDFRFTGFFSWTSYIPMTFSYMLPVILVALKYRLVPKK